MSAIGRSPTEWNLCRSAFSADILNLEHDVEKKCHLFQTMTERSEGYSYAKGIVSLFVKVPFGVVGVLAALIEGVVRLILAGITYLFSLCHEAWKEVPGNLLRSAVSTDRTHEQWSALLVFVTSFALPFSEVSYMLAKLWSALVVRKPPTHD